jgi:hypothetical protein
MKIGLQAYRLARSAPLAILLGDPLALRAKSTAQAGLKTQIKANQSPVCEIRSRGTQSELTYAVSGLYFHDQRTLAVRSFGLFLVHNEPCQMLEIPTTNKLTYPTAVIQGVTQGMHRSKRPGIFAVSRTRDCESPPEWQRKISPTRNSGAPSRARMVKHENERISRRP